MKVELKIDQEVKETKVTIEAFSRDEEVNDLINYLSHDYEDSIKGYIDQEMYIIKEEDILHIFAEKQKVVAITRNGRYIIHSRLYELEERLNKRLFVRISNSEIINVKKILRLDASLSGTIAVYIEGDIKTYASRRYVPKIKKILGL